MLIWTQSTGFQLSWLSTLDLYEVVDNADSAEGGIFIFDSYFQGAFQTKSSQKAV